MSISGLKEEVGGKELSRFLHLEAQPWTGCFASIAMFNGWYGGPDKTKVVLKITVMGSDLFGGESKWFFKVYDISPELRNVKSILDTFLNEQQEDKDVSRALLVLKCLL